jgi:NADH:ubiquinone oxidoreductase subunit K
MLLGQILIISTTGVKLDDIVCEIFTLKIFILAAAESAIGLTILIGYFRIRGKIEW